jgi:hypothetical protein
MYALIARGGIDGESMGLATALLDRLKPAAARRAR